jgi:hypothetical protein
MDLNKPLQNQYLNLKLKYLINGKLMKSALEKNVMAIEENKIKLLVD